jgi:hypothetical protein
MNEITIEASVVGLRAMRPWDQPCWHIDAINKSHSKISEITRRSSVAFSETPVTGEAIYLARSVRYAQVDRHELVFTTKKLISMLRRDRLDCATLRRTLPPRRRPSGASY